MANRLHLRSWIALLLVGALGFALVASAEPAPAPGAAVAQSTGLRIIGPDNAVQTLAPADLAALPAVEVQATIKGAHGEDHGTFKGPLLWSVLDHAGLLGGDMRARLRHAILATGSDGYMVLVSIGELDPEFEGKPVILALSKDGNPIAGGRPRLIVPGDQRGGRAVRDVVEIRFQ
jgi:hypothetical protein